MSDTIKIVAFCGKMKSGKTSSAIYLTGKQNYIRLRFAERLKKMLRDGLGIDTKYIDGDMKFEPCPELCGQTARHAMITLGTEWGRKLINRDIWVNLLQNDMIKLITEEGKTKFVIDDLRFRSEFEWLKQLRRIKGMDVKVVIIKLKRPGIVDNVDHESETDLDNVLMDHVIDNDGTPYKLFYNVEKTLIREGL